MHDTCDSMGQRLLVTSCRCCIFLCSAVPQRCSGSNMAGTAVWPETRSLLRIQTSYVSEMHSNSLPCRMYSQWYHHLSALRLPTLVNMIQNVEGRAWPRSLHHPFCHPLQLSRTVCRALESITCQTTRQLDIMHDRMLAQDEDQGDKI